MNNKLYSNEKCVLNPLNQTEYCKLLSTKKEKLYKYTYNPANILENITNYIIDLNPLQKT